MTAQKIVKFIKQTYGLVSASLSVIKLGSIEAGAKAVLGNEAALGKKADNININLLQTRRDEKNFLMRNDLQYFS